MKKLPKDYLPKLTPEHLTENDLWDSNWQGMTIEWIPIKDVVHYLPHEEVNAKEVKEIVQRLQRKPLVKPITVYEGVICDGHHRWNAMKHLYENVRGWKNKTIPVCFLEGMQSAGATWEEILDAAESGELMPYKSTHTTPRGPAVKMAIKNEKR